MADLPPEERLRSAHVVYPDGRRESAGAAARAVLEALPSADALARLTGASPRATEVVYRWIADHRSLVSRLVPADAKRRAAGVVDAAAVR